MARPSADALAWGGSCCILCSGTSNAKLKIGWVEPIGCWTICARDFCSSLIQLEHNLQRHLNATCKGTGTQQKEQVTIHQVVIQPTHLVHQGLAPTNSHGKHSSTSHGASGSRFLGASQQSRFGRNLRLPLINCFEFKVKGAKEHSQVWYFLHCWPLLLHCLTLCCCMSRSNPLHKKLAGRSHAITVALNGKNTKHQILHPFFEKKKEHLTFWPKHSSPERTQHPPCTHTRSLSNYVCVCPPLENSKTWPEAKDLHEYVFGSREKVGFVFGLPSGSQNVRQWLINLHFLQLLTPKFRLHVIEVTPTLVKASLICINQELFDSYKEYLQHIGSCTHGDEQLNPRHGGMTPDHRHKSSPGKKGQILEVLMWSWVWLAIFAFRFP